MKTCQSRSFEALIARAGRSGGRDVVFSSMPAEADRQATQLRHLLVELGATADTSVTLLSDGAEGPRHLGAQANPRPVRHVLDWLQLAMRVQHVAQTVAGWASVVPADRERAAGLANRADRVRWRLWHGHADRAVALIGKIQAALDASPMDDRSLGGAHRVLKARAAATNATPKAHHAKAERFARRPFRRAA